MDFKGLDFLKRGVWSILIAYSALLLVLGVMGRAPGLITHALIASVIGAMGSLFDATASRRLWHWASGIACICISLKAATETIAMIAGVAALFNLAFASCGLWLDTASWRSGGAVKRAPDNKRGPWQ